MANVAKKRCPSCGELVKPYRSPEPPDPEALRKVAERYRDFNDRIEAHYASETRLRVK